MLLIGEWLSGVDAGFDVVRYITLRAIFSALTALVLCLLFGPRLIRWLLAGQDRSVGAGRRTGEAT